MNKMMTVILSAVVGGVIGYAIGANKESKRFYKIIDEAEPEVIPMSQRVSPEDKSVLEDLAAKYRTEDDHPTEDEPEEPYVITYDEFAEIGGNYTSLSYYYDDEILVDEDDHTVDIGSTVGNCLSKFGVGTDDEDMVYVKNPKTGKYYEVTRLFELYFPDLMDYNIDETL